MLTISNTLFLIILLVVSTHELKFKKKLNFKHLDLIVSKIFLPLSTIKIKKTSLLGSSMIFKRAFEELMFKFSQRNKIEIPFKSVDEIKSAYNFTNLDSFLK